MWRFRRAILAKPLQTRSPSTGSGWESLPCNVGNLFGTSGEQTFGVAAIPRPFTRAQALQNRAFLERLAVHGNARLAARETGVRISTMHHRRGGRRGARAGVGCGGGDGQCAAARLP